MTKLDAKTLKAVTGGTNACPPPAPPACPPANNCGGKSKTC